MMHCGTSGDVTLQEHLWAHSSDDVRGSFIIPTVGTQTRPPYEFPLRHNGVIKPT